MITRPVADNQIFGTGSKFGKQENYGPVRDVITVVADNHAGLTATHTFQTCTRAGYADLIHNVLNLVTVTAHGGNQNVINKQYGDTVRQHGEEIGRDITGASSVGNTLGSGSRNITADFRCKSCRKTVLACFPSAYPGRDNLIYSGQMHPSRFDRRRARQLTPHDTLEASRAFGVMRKPFFLDYLHGGDEQEIGIASDVFEGDAWQRAIAETSLEALNTPVLLTDRMSDRTFAGYVTTSNPTIPCAILVNTRFKVDPEVLAHALAEEVVHAQQDIDGVDFAGQKAVFAYADRPYEKDAKERATKIVGYEPDDYADYKWREVPDGALFDRLSGMAECRLYAQRIHLPASSGDKAEALHDLIKEALIRLLPQLHDETAGWRRSTPRFRAEMLLSGRE